MHRPPPSCERTGGDHFGERNSWRVETTPFSPLQSTNNTSARPSTLLGGTPLRRAPSTSLPQFLTKKEEFSTYPSSGLCWRETHNTEKEKAASRATYFQVSAASRSRCSDHRPENSALLHLLSALQMEQSVTASSRKGRVIDSKFDLILFSVWVAGSLELIVALQVVGSVARMKCIYKLCLVYNCQEQQGVLSAKGCHLPFQQPRINV